MSGCSGSYFVRHQGNGGSEVGNTKNTSSSEASSHYSPTSVDPVTSEEANSVSSKTVERIGTIGVAEAPAGIKGKIVDFHLIKDVIFDVEMNHKSKDEEYLKYYFQDHKPEAFLLIHYNDFAEVGSMAVGCEAPLSVLGTAKAMKEALVKENIGIQLSGNVFKYYKLASGNERIDASATFSNEVG